MKRQKSLCYCINLRRTANAVSSLYDKYLQPSGLTVNQFSLLRNIERMGSCSVTHLSEAIGLERTTLVRTLQPLLDRDLIEDIAESGRRARKIQLTEMGKEALTEGDKYWMEAQKEIEHRVGKDEIVLLLELLERMEN